MPWSRHLHANAAIASEIRNAKMLFDLIGFIARSRNESPAWWTLFEPLTESGNEFWQILFKKHVRFYDDVWTSRIRSA